TTLFRSRHRTRTPVGLGHVARRGAAGAAVSIMASNPREADVDRSQDRNDIGIQVRIDAGDKVLDGELVMPRVPRGVVAFAHGSGSSRFSPRNRAVAEVLQRGGLATLLFDLLTDVEAETDDRTAALRFDIDLLARRLAGAVRWLAAEP